MSKPDRISKPGTGALPKALRVGFVPLTDCAPLLMAQELGLFAKYGLTVQLKRELGWATIRDKIIYGELDAAHAVAGMPFAATFGLGSIPSACLTGLVLSLNGNAITLSQELWENGVRDAKSLREYIVTLRGQKILTFGMVFPFSSHNFLLRQWLQSGGVDPDRDVRIVVVPPPQMFVNLKARTLDGYCVGEPWNSLAVQSRAGWCVAASAQLAPGHPEKVLMVRRSFAEERAAEHTALIAALIEACAYCDQAGNADRIVNMLARPRCLNLSAGALERSMRGVFDFGRGRMEAVPDFHVFHRSDANAPTAGRAAWIMRSMLQAGVVSHRPDFTAESASKIFCEDIFQDAQQLLDRKPPLNQDPEPEPGLVNV